MLALENKRKQNKKNRKNKKKKGEGVDRIDIIFAKSERFHGI